MIRFDPKNSSGGVIQAAMENGRWFFKSEDTNYEWIADLKDFLGQKICDQISGRQGVVGLDEYEWLRRQSRDWASSFVFIVAVARTFLKAPTILNVPSAI